MDPVKYDQLSFPSSNENLRAINAGLDLQPDDIVLAICGSGDQPLSMLASGARVKAVDKEDLQLEYAQERRDLLKKGDLEEFYWPFDEEILGEIGIVERKRHNEYFEEIMDQIVENIDRISFHKTDDILMTDFVGVNKVYLSNAFEHNYKNLHERIMHLLTQLPIGTVIYTSERTPLLEGYIPIDQELTERARSHNEWAWVYRVNRCIERDADFEATAIKRLELYIP